MKINLKKMPDLTSEVKNNSGIPSFDFEEFPVGYFSDNIKGKLLRKQLIKNQLKISECNVGDLEKTFFSKENIDLINKQLILSVYNSTNKQFFICDQKEADLLIVMRYVFIEYSRMSSISFRFFDPYQVKYEARNKIKQPKQGQKRYFII